MVATITLNDIPKVENLSPQQLETVTGYENDSDMLETFIHEMDKGTPWMTEGNYAWYHCLGNLIEKNFVIAEIGVRFGYSAISLIMDQEYSDFKYYGFDNEEYYAGSNKIANKSLRSFLPEENIKILKVNTQCFDELPGLELNSVDLFHVDGSHYTDTALHDLDLALKHVKCNGYILIDDTTMNTRVREAVRIFLENHGDKIDLNYSKEIPSKRGMILLKMNF